MNIHEILKRLEFFRYRHDIPTVVSDVFEMLSCKVSNAFDLAQADKREKYRLEVLQRYSEPERAVIEQITQLIISMLQSIALEKAFDDYLGKIFMGVSAGNKKLGQFFTPYQVSQLMAALCFDESILKKEIITINEPTCGSGGTILAALEVLINKGINYTDHVLVVANDIDRRCVIMTYLQLSYAGVPAVVLCGNTLTQDFSEYWLTPAYMLQYKKFTKIYNNLRT